MSYITGKSLSRRTLLRGAGITVALPLLNAMIPAGTLLAKTAALTAAKPVKRLSYVFMPMGCDHTRWTPKGETLDELPYILESLAPVRDQINIISNLEVANAYPGSHATSNSSFLSCARAKQTESTDYHLGTTADQIAAQRIGQGTKLPSLELSMDLMHVVGQCDNGYACVYQNNLSWSSPTTPLPSEAHPRIVFESMFGEGGNAKERLASLHKQGSLLDAMLNEINRLKNDVDASDRRKIDQYIQSIREVERRIQKAESDVDAKALPDLERPLGVPASFADHAKLMFDLQVLAMQGDITRVTTFQLARETSERSYPELGVSESHHPLSHHGNDPKKIEKMARINQFHVSLFAYFLKKLNETPDGDGTLLSNTLCLYGSGMGNPNIHDHTNLPMIIAGGSALGMKGGRHIRYDKVTPLANVHLTLLDKVGVDLEQFADSTGMTNELFESAAI
ncbi:MAG: DUF1552 domain-containing protein [Planctomycetes bacterium]|nr:DUF1552 domain-containing protein [Planctomycetota bacterium]